MSGARNPHATNPAAPLKRPDFTGLELGRLAHELQAAQTLLEDYEQGMRGIGAPTRMEMLNRSIAAVAETRARIQARIKQEGTK